ncbi:MAG: glycosyltransferase family 4 protein [Acidobacteriaceae bacterium]
MHAAHQLYTAPLPRILFVTATPASVRAGSGTYVGISALRKALLNLGFDVQLIAPRGNPVSALSRLWFNFRVRISASATDLIVGFDLDGVFLSPHPTPDIACIKGVIAEELQFERGWKRLSLLLQSWFEKRRVRHATRIITTSHYAARAIERRYGVPAKQIRIVPELIELDHWRAALRQAYPQPRPHPTILCVAHLYPRKDIATLLRAISQLETPASLRIVGVGPELARLRRLSRQLHLEDRITFLEHISFGQLAEEYRSAHIFCLPSRQEGFGIVLLEAMAAGLPIVAARAGAIPEVVPDRQCALLITPGDATAFAAALDALLTRPALRQQLRDAGLAHVSRYDAPLVARQFLAAIGLAAAT